MAWWTLDLHVEGLAAPPVVHTTMLCKRRRGLLPPLEMPC